MVLPLIVLIIVAVFFLLVVPFIIKIAKIALVIIALAVIFKILKSKFKVIKNLANWEITVIAISIGAGILALGSHFGVFAVSGLPMAVQNPLIQASLSPFNLFLGFIIGVLVMMYVYRK